MNKTSLKIFICFTLTSAVIAVILLFINIFGYVYIVADSDGENSKKNLADISENMIQTDNGFELKEGILPENYWCILIDERGNVIWSQNKPEDIPDSYSINDVARFTHWFLNDYPVYVRIEDYGLLVMGIPKNTVGKYEVIYSMKWFDTLPKRIITILSINLCIAAVLAFVFGIRLYRRLCVLTDGISSLRSERPVRLEEKGIFKEISANVNRTSDAIERKNEALTVRDNARSNWISGISHDIRTPLSLIIGYSDELLRSGKLNEAEYKKATAITAQGIKIKKLIEDLSLISSLEYDMQPSKKTEVKICPLLRHIVSDVINSGTADNCEIELELNDERAAAAADETLLERAVYNIINNSIVHNENGCKIRITENTEAGKTIVEISDNGKGVPREVIDGIYEIPKSAHGMGLPMAYRIIKAHGGNFTIRNDNGLKTRIELY